MTDHAYIRAYERHVAGLQARLETYAANPRTVDRTLPVCEFLTHLSDDTRALICDALNEEHARVMGEPFVMWNNSPPSPDPVIRALSHKEEMAWLFLLVCEVAALEEQAAEFDRAYAEYIDLDR